MSPLRSALLGSAPYTLVFNLSWWGVFTFVNAYIVRGLGRSNQDWVTASICFTVGVVFWQLVSTEIASRVGRRNTMFAAMLVFAACLAVVGHVTNLWAIGAILAVSGFMSATLGAVWFPMMAQTGGDRPGRALVLGQFILAGMGVLALGGGGQLVQTGDYRMAFHVLAAVSAVCAFVFYALTRDLESKTPVQVMSLFRVRRADVVELLRGPFLVVTFLGFCMEPFGFHTANQLYPNLARDVHGLSESAIGLTVGAGRIPALLVLLVLSRYIDRLRPTRCYGAGMMLAALTVAGMGLADSKALVVALFFAFYVGHGVEWSANAASLNACVAPRLRDPAFAVNSVVMVGAMAVVGAIHRAMLGADWPLPRVFVVCGATLAVAGVAMFVRAPHRKPLRPQAAKDKPELHGID